MARTTASRHLTACLTALALLLPALASAAADKPKDAGGAAGWSDLLPPRTIFAVKLDPSTFRDFADAFSARGDFDADEALFPATDPASTAIGGFLTGEIDDTIDGDSERLASLEFEHVDSKRPFLLAMSVSGHDYLFETARLGIPPTDTAKLVGPQVVRLIVPATDAAKLEAALEESCETRLECESMVSVEARGDWLLVDRFTNDRYLEDSPDDYAFETDADWFPDDTPASRAFLERDAGLAVYAKAESWADMATLEAGDYLHRQVAQIEEAADEDRPFEIRQARRDISEMMLMDDIRSPKTRETRDLAIFGWGDGERNLMVEAMQTYTNYGARLAKTGRVDVDLPVLGIPRPILSGSWRFDLRTAIDSAETPRWLASPLVDGSAAMSAWKTVSETNGFAAFVSAVNHPISAAAGAMNLANKRGIPPMFNPSRYSSIVGGSFSFDVDPVALTQGGIGLQGGLALVLRSDSAAAFGQLVDMARGALGVAVESEVEQRGDLSVMKLRVDTANEFTDSGGSKSTRLSGHLNPDRLRAKLEVLGDQTPRFPTDLFELMTFMDDLRYQFDSNDKVRVARLKLGPYEAPEVSFPEGRFELTSPESNPQCFVEASRASKRLYIRHVDTGPYYKKRSSPAVKPGSTSARISTSKRPSSPSSISSQNRPDESSRPIPDAELDVSTRAEIEKLTDKLADWQTSCAEEGEKWGADVARIRNYWKAVLDGGRKTYPTEGDEKGDSSE